MIKQIFINWFQKNFQCNVCLDFIWQVNLNARNSFKSVYSTHDCCEIKELFGNYVLERFCEILALYYYHKLEKKKDNCAFKYHLQVLPVKNLFHKLLRILHAFPHVSPVVIVKAIE